VVVGKLITAALLTCTRISTCVPSHEHVVLIVHFECNVHAHVTKKNVFKGVTTSKDLAAVFSEQVFEVETRELFAQEFAGRLKDILNHMEHNGGMAADNVFAGAPIRTQTGGMTHLQR
jgi:hypothetical protein